MKHKRILEEEIKQERENMLQALFPSERIRHASRIVELEKQLEEVDERKDYAKRIAGLEERDE